MVFADLFFFSCKGFEENELPLKKSCKNQVFCQNVLRCLKVYNLLIAKS